MGKRKSIYEQKLKMLQDEFHPLDGLSGLNIRLIKFGRCMNLVEINDTFEKLKSKLAAGEIVMDECLNYEEWYDMDRWKFNKESGKYEVEENSIVKSLVNSMQNYKANENNKINKAEVRDKILTGMSIIASQIYLSDEELDEICYEGIKKLMSTLKEIHDITLYKEPASEEYVKISGHYREMAEKRWLKASEYSKEYQKWKNQQLDLEVEDLVDYRGKLIRQIMECEVCKGSEEQFRWRENDKEKYEKETSICEELSGMSDETLRRYAYFRRIYSFDGKIYSVKNEEKLGKHLYIHRETLTDEDISEYYLLTSMVERVQKDMNFSEIRPEDDDLEKKVWKNLQNANVVDAKNQPIGLSLEDRSLLAKEIATALGINDVWAYFSEIWNESKESLRKAYARKMEKEDAGDLMNKYRKIIGL